MTKNYHDPIDAIRDLLNEEYECDSSEEIREDDEEAELDWNREVWVKGGGGTWQAKQLRKRLQEHCRELIKMAKEDRFSPSKAHTIYAYSDTLHDFVNGELDEPEDARESTQTPEEAEHELSEFFSGRKKLPVGRKYKKLDDLGDALVKGFKDSGMAPTEPLDNTHGKYAFRYTKGDASDAGEVIMHITGVAEGHRVGDLIRSWRYPTGEDKGYVVQLWWRHGKVEVTEYDRTSEDEGGYLGF